MGVVGEARRPQTMAHVGQKRAWSETREEGLLAQLCNGVEGSTVLEGLVQKNEC